MCIIARPSVEQANSLSSTHSKVLKEVSGLYSPYHSHLLFLQMILVTDPARPLEMTAKLTPRRSVVLMTYKSEIDAAYITVSISKHCLYVPSTWSSHQILIFVRSVVHAVMARNTPIGDHDDIFEYGADRYVDTIFIPRYLLDLIVVGAVFKRCILGTQLFGPFSRKTRQLAHR